MKKVLYISILAAAALVSCTKFVEDEPKDYGTTSAPVLSEVAVFDDSLSFDVTPAKGNNYYAVTVFEGEVEADAETVLECGYTSGVKFKKCVLAKNNASIPVRLPKLDFNQDYTICAVASNENGVLSKLVTKVIKTPDTVLPELDLEAITCEEDTAIIHLAFTEPVEFVEGSVIKTTVYAKMYLTGTPIMKDIVGEVSENEDGGYDVSFPFALPGSYYVISFDEGAFVDGVGNKIAALPYGKFDSKGACTGVYGLIDNKGFCNVEVEYPEVIKDYNQYFVHVKLTSDIVNKEGWSSPITIPNYVARGVAKFVDVYYTSSDGVHTTTVQSTLSGAPYYGAALNYSTFSVKLKEKPNGGDIVKIVIKEGAFSDMYGRPNEEIVIENMAYTYGFTIDDFCGTFNFKGSSKYYGTVQNEVVIMPNEAKDSLYMINFLANYPINDMEVYQGLPTTATAGVFNKDSGIITWMPSVLGMGQDSKYWTSGGFILYMGFVDEVNGTFTMSMTTPGKITLAEQVNIYALGCGNWDTLKSGTLTRTSTEYNLPSTEAAIPYEKPRPGSFTKKSAR